MLEIYIEAILIDGGGNDLSKDTLRESARARI